MVKKKVEVKNEAKKSNGIKLIEITKPKSSDYYQMTENELTCTDKLPKPEELPLDNDGNLLSVFAYKIDGKWYIE